MKTVEKIITGFDPEEKYLLPALREVAAEHFFISLKDAKKLADYFSLPLSKVYETASFYDLIGTEKKPPLVIQICSGGECVLGGGSKLIKEIENNFGIKADGEGNRLVKLERISCLGRCQEGPIMVINGHEYSEVKTEKLGQILENWLAHPIQ
jgi:NADH-quinone oxidoreductase subunit E